MYAYYKMVFFLIVFFVLFYMYLPESDISWKIGERMPHPFFPLSESGFPFSFL